MTAELRPLPAPGTIEAFALYFLAEGASQFMDRIDALDADPGHGYHASWQFLHWIDRCESVCGEEGDAAT